MYLFFLLLLFPLFSFSHPPSDTEWIAAKIFHNECSSNPEKLVWWNEGESFPSLGIGHFIWYPVENKAPFVETFPQLIAFFKTQGIKIPEWLQGSCPWKSKAEFSAPTERKKRQRLKKLLEKTLSLQCTFIHCQFEKALSQLLDAIPPEDAAVLRQKIERLSQTKKGRYALLDYTHFKGIGTAASERYKSQAWGLKQVLEAMPLQEDPVVAFVHTAEGILRQRVANAPPARGEERWLPGWISRVRSYL